jgi:hypothetical protein
MCGLVVASLAIMPIYFIDNVDESLIHSIEIMELTISGIFLTEFIVRFFLSSDKSNYFKHYWWLLLAAIPIPSALGPLLKSFRLLGLVKLIRLLDHYEYEKIYDHELENK